MAPFLTEIFDLAQEALVYSKIVCEEYSVVPRTTLMLRNVPNKFTRDELLFVVSERMNPGEFDFFYLPSDFRSGCNFGYAFINLCSEKSVNRFFQLFQRLALRKQGARKTCQVSFARVQGLEANIARLMNSPIMGASHLFSEDIESAMPLLFDSQGVPFAFPRPDPLLVSQMMNSRVSSSLECPPHRKPDRRLVCKNHPSTFEQLI